MQGFQVADFLGQEAPVADDAVDRHDHQQAHTHADHGQREIVDQRQCSLAQSMA